MHAKGKFQVFVAKTEDGWESEGGEWPGCLIGQASVHEYQIDPDVPAGLTVLAPVSGKADNSPSFNQNYDGNLYSWFSGILGPLFGNWA